MEEQRYFIKRVLVSATSMWLDSDENWSRSMRYAAQYTMEECREIDRRSSVAMEFVEVDPATLEMQRRSPLMRVVMHREDYMARRTPHGVRTKCGKTVQREYASRYEEVTCDECLRACRPVARGESAGIVRKAKNGTKLSKRLMPFGPHKNKPMSMVPEEYLHKQNEKGNLWGWPKDYYDEVVRDIK